MFPRGELCVISPESVDANKSIAKGMMAVGIIFVLNALLDRSPFIASVGAGFAGLGALHYWAYKDYERQTQNSPSPRV